MYHKANTTGIMSYVSKHYILYIVWLKTMLIFDALTAKRLIWRHLSSSQMCFFPKSKSNNSAIFGCLIVLRETYQQKFFFHIIWSIFILYYPLKPSILASPFLIHPQTWSTLQDPQRFNCDDSKRVICPWGSSSCPKVCASWAWKKMTDLRNGPKNSGQGGPSLCDHLMSVKPKAEVQRSSRGKSSGWAVKFMMCPLPNGGDIHIIRNIRRAFPKFWCKSR